MAKLGFTTNIQLQLSSPFFGCPVAGTLVSFCPCLRFLSHTAAFAKFAKFANSFDLKFSFHHVATQNRPFNSFELGPSLQPYNVRLFCNHPLDSKTSFERNKYYELTWSCTAGKPCDDADRFADLIACIAGSFHFYVAYKDVEEKE